MHPGGPLEQLQRSAFPPFLSDFKSTSRAVLTSCTHAGGVCSQGPYKAPLPASLPAAVRPPPPPTAVSARHALHTLSAGPLPDNFLMSRRDLQLSYSSCLQSPFNFVSYNCHAPFRHCFCSVPPPPPRAHTPHRSGRVTSWTQLPTRPAGTPQRQQVVVCCGSGAAPAAVLTTRLHSCLTPTAASVARRRTLSGTPGWPLTPVESCAASEWFSCICVCV